MNVIAYFVACRFNKPCANRVQGLKRSKGNTFYISFT